MANDKQAKAVKLLQDRSADLLQRHQTIDAKLVSVRQALEDLGVDLPTTDREEIASNEISETAARSNILVRTSISEIFVEAETAYTGSVELTNLLTNEQLSTAAERVSGHIAAFNRQYDLDALDYAIACSCGLFAAMLDLICVKAPLKPTTAFETPADGIFNRWVQNAFNATVTPELSAKLAAICKIGSADASVITQLIGAQPKTINPTNHRLRSLAHDPVLGIIFGVLDMLRGTCTVVVNGEIKAIPGKSGPMEGNIFQMVGRMLGHLLSDVNAPSANGNRGMGLPAPFMGLLRMFEGLEVGDSNFARQIEWMYVKGYDFRQFVVTSVPMAIMEALMRAFYVSKQVVRNEASFGQTLLETMPGKMSPRFRTMLALGYGTSSAVNAGKVYVTQNLLNANYASWMGLAWNGFHALKWSLIERPQKLWDSVSEAEIAGIQLIIDDLDALENRASSLSQINLKSD
jgi:hypothetical protein